MIRICSRKLALSMAFVVPMLVRTSSHAEVLSFAAVRDSSIPQAEYDSLDFSYTQSDRRSDSSVATAAISSGDAKAQTTLGVNRIAVDSNAIVDDEGLRSESVGGPFAVGVSVWIDQFTILGSGGSGIASVSASVTGEFGPKPGPSYGGQGGYYLFVATSNQIASLFSKPFEFLVSTDVCELSALCLEQNVLKPGTNDPGESVREGSPFGRMLKGNVSFNYGEPFYMVSLLAGAANDYGVLNAFNSAKFGISAPTDAVMTTLSGNTYAAAVPEPTASAMSTAGLVLMGAAMRYRRKKSR